METTRDKVGTGLPRRSPAAGPERVPLREGEPGTLVEAVARALRKHARPDTLNSKYGGEWRAVSSEELARRSRAIALGLYASGLRRGDRAAIISESSPEWVLVDVGCQSAGVVDVPIYPTLAPNQARYIMDDSGSSVLFAQHREAYERVSGALAECAALRQVVLMTGEGGEEGNVITLAELERRGEALDAERPGLAEELAGAVEPDDLATIIYTSGTTGEPKGVMLTH
ncbi:MAG TPA: AMP-binding protein, partial [Pyrinomonadaceae bacterium]|nr:AMP-binding protein [Pyrinomonadaceae bacterium]